MKHVRSLGLSFFVVFATGCMPGYIKSKDLEAKGQGPSSCAKACEDLGMRMTAMVLVGDTVPGCVCQVLAQAPVGGAVAPTDVPATAPTAPAPTPSSAPLAPEPGAAPQGALPPAPVRNDARPEQGAAASTGGFVLIAAAAAARQQQQERERQNQQQKK